MAIVQVTWVSLLLIGGWMVAAYVAQRLYVENLQDSIHHYRLDAERASATGLDRKATDLLATKLGGEDPSEVLYALRLLSAGAHHATHPAVRGLIAHASPEVRAEAVRLLDESGDTGVVSAIEKLLHDPELTVRTQALAVRRAPRADRSARPHREARRVRGFLDPRRDGDVPRAAGQTRKYRRGARPARSHAAGRGAARRGSRRRDCSKSCRIASRISCARSSRAARPIRSVMRCAPSAGFASAS